MVFDVLLLTFTICMAIWFCILETRFYKDTMHELERGNEKMRRYAAQTTDPKKKAKAEESIHESEEVKQKWRALHIGMLTVILMGTLGNPVAHATGSWFLHIRPELILLRSGVPVRATITRRKHWLLTTRLEMGFTTERGKSVRKKQFLPKKEASLFENGTLVWMLYLPRRPKCARIYGLKSALAEIVR